MNKFSKYCVAAVFFPLVSAHATGGALPIYFEKDPEAARFQTRAQGRGLLFQTGEVRIAVGIAEFGLNFRGGRPDAQPHGLKPTAGYSNYFVNDGKREWRERREHFGAVGYDRVWPGIDLIFDGHGSELEYDFRLDAGADPRVIRLKTAGVNSVRIDHDGDLWLKNGSAEIRQRRPSIYQEIGGRRRNIAGGYRLYGGNEIGFWVGDYDNRQPLVIDPILEFATYLGGQGFDAAVGMALDSANNVYVTGYTELSDFFRARSTTTPFQSSNRNQDAFLAKLDGKTKQIVYLIFYGGSATEIPWSVAVDKDGAATIVGRTFSSDLPVRNADIRAPQLLNLTSYGFAAHFSADGKQIVYATYTGPGVAYGVAVSSSGEVAVAGQTYCTISNSNPALHEFVPTSGALQTSCVDPGDPTGFPSVGFIEEFGKTGSKDYASYYESTGSAPASGTLLNDIAFDPQDNLLVAVSAAGKGAITQADGSRRPEADCEIAKIDRALKTRVWSRHFGGDQDDECLRIAVDSSGNAYSTGYTTSTGLPTTGAVFQPAIGSAQTIPDPNPHYPGRRTLYDGFVVKLAANTGQPLYLTYLGGNGDDYGWGIAADSSGRAYITGYTNSRNFPITSGAYQTSFGGGKSDSFLVTVAPDGSKLEHASFFGGLGQDEGYQVALDTDGNLWVAGTTESSNLPVSSEAAQSSQQGSSDIFIAKLNLQSCQLTLANQTGTVAASSGTYTINITTSSPSCPWTASSLSPFVQVSPAKGNGKGALQVTISANTSTAPRVGFFEVNARRTFVFQDGGKCRFVITPSELAVSGNAEQRTISIQASDQTCAWTAQSDQSWVTLSPSASGTGNGTITVVTSPNSDAVVRTANLTIGSEPPVPISQASGQCAITLSSESGSISPAGGLGAVGVLATADQCGWQAQTQDSWLTILFGASGYGNGKVRFAAAPNTTGQARTGTITVIGQQFQITQDFQYTSFRDAAGTQVSSSGTTASESRRPVPMAPGVSPRAGLSTCGLTKPQLPIQVDANGASLTLTIKKQFAGCAGFQPTANVPWLHPSVPGSLSATPIQMSISADVNNQTTSPRNGTITWITGDTNDPTWQLDVVQAGAVRTKLALQPSTTPQQLAAQAGTQDVTVQAADGVSPCTWTVDRSGVPDWLHPDVTSGPCNSTMHLAYDANQTPSARTAALQFDTAQTLSLVQDASAPPAASCAYNFVETTPVDVPAGGGSVTLHVNAAPGSCAWSVSTNHPDWVTFPQGGAGTGTGTLAVNIAANNTVSLKVAKISIGDEQAAAYVQVEPALATCSYTVTPAGANFGSNGGTGSFQVQTGASCAWTATAPASAPWLHIVDGASGSGNGTVSFTVDVNPGNSPRTATISVQGQSFSVSQDAGSVTCSYTLLPTSANFDFNGGSGSFQVQTDASCAWSASVPSTAPWLKITAGASGTGSGVLTFSVDPNPANSAARTSTISVQGQIFTVSQSAGPGGCAYTLSPASASFDSKGGSGSFQVQTSAGCAWTAAVPVLASWLKITSGGSGSGNGTVNFSVDPNAANSPARNAAIAVQGQTFNVTQAAGPLATISANPNPITTCNAQGLGKTTITWSTNAPGNITVGVGDPSVVWSSGPQGSAETGEWFSGPANVYLVADGAVLAQVLVTTTCGPPSGTLTASPNPLPLCAPATTGNVTLTWTAQNVTAVEVHQTAFDGPRVASGGAAGSANVVTAPGTTFFLVNTSGGVAPSAATVLAQVTVTQGDCPALPPGIAPPTGDLIEGVSAWNFEFFAQGNAGSGAAIDVNDPNGVLEGKSSIAAEAITADQIRMTLTVPQPSGQTGLTWDLSKISALVFSIQTTFPGDAWKSGSPSIRLVSANGSVTLSPNSSVGDASAGGWLQVLAPLAGNSIWQRTVTGQFDLTRATAIQLSFDAKTVDWAMLIDAMHLR